VPACPGAVIDGTTQTAFGGDTNPAQVGGMAVGAAGVPLPLIDGPEIELRGIGLTLGADGMTVRGLALGSLGSNSDDLTIEGCWFGSEPQVPFALPAELRAGTNTLLYLADVGGTQGHTNQPQRVRVVDRDDEPVQRPGRGLERAVGHPRQLHDRQRRRLGLGRAAPQPRRSS
jgi:hypothetical protein